MKTAFAANNRLLELYHIDENNKCEDYCPQVIQIVEDEISVDIYHGNWNVSTDYDRKVFIGPENLWQEVIYYIKDIEDFILESIKVAPIVTKSEFHIWHCDDGYMYMGPVERKGLNWITFLAKSRNIYVGHNSNDKKKELETGLLEGSIKPIPEEYFDFIVNDVARRIKLIKRMILSLYNPY